MFIISVQMVFVSAALYVRSINNICMVPLMDVLNWLNYYRIGMGKQIEKWGGDT